MSPLPRLTHPPLLLLYASLTIPINCMKASIACGRTWAWSSTEAWAWEWEWAWHWEPLAKNSKVRWLVWSRRCHRHSHNQSDTTQWQRFANGCLTPLPPAPLPLPTPFPSPSLFTLTLFSNALLPCLLRFFFFLPCCYSAFFGFLLRDRKGKVGEGKGWGDNCCLALTASLHLNSLVCNAFFDLTSCFNVAASSTWVCECACVCACVCVRVYVCVLRRMRNVDCICVQRGVCAILITMCNKCQRHKKTSLKSKSSTWRRREGREGGGGVWLGEVKEVEEEPVSGCMNLLKAHKMQSIFSGITHKSGRKTQALTASLHLSFPLSLSLSLFASFTHSVQRGRHFRCKLAHATLH